MSTRPSVRIQNGPLWITKRTTNIKTDQYPGVLLKLRFEQHGDIRCTETRVRAPGRLDASQGVLVSQRAKRRSLIDRRVKRVPAGMWLEFCAARSPATCE